MSVKQQNVNTSKAVLLNLKQELLNQVLLIILMHLFSNDTDVAFKNCASFSTCKTVINDVFVDRAEHIYIAMPIYNLIEYSDNCLDTSESLWQFKIDEVPSNNADLTIKNSQSFKYKVVLVGKTANHNERFWRFGKI